MWSCDAVACLLGTAHKVMTEEIIYNCGVCVWQCTRLTFYMHNSISIFHSCLSPCALNSILSPFFLSSFRFFHVLLIPWYIFTLPPQWWFYFPSEYIHLCFIIFAPLLGALVHHLMVENRLHFTCKTQQHFINPMCPFTALSLPLRSAVFLLLF